MPISIQVALDIHDRELGKVMVEDCLNSAAISFTEGPRATGEPNIFFIEDRPGDQDVLQKIVNLREQLPNFASSSSLPMPTLTKSSRR